MEKQSDGPVTSPVVSATNTSHMRRLVIYRRTSTHDGSGGDSLDAQEDFSRAGGRRRTQCDLTIPRRGTRPTPLARSDSGP
jgi:hypothetical protein